jgi:hypothetical protein
MSKPIAPAMGIAFAFPDVCKTPTPGGPVPLPYPNVAQLNQATGVSNTGAPLLVGPSSFPVLLLDSRVPVTTGDEAGSLGGVLSGTIKGPCVVRLASATVLYGSSSKGIARFLDTTSHNNDNAQGMLLSAFPTVLVGD